jgi:hypothetical protein
MTRCCAPDLKQVFDNAIEHLQTCIEAQEHADERLRHTFSYWLRHTAGSHMMDGQVDLRYVRDDMGHKAISTTSQYLHADDDNRHRAATAHLSPSNEHQLTIVQPRSVSRHTNNHGAEEALSDAPFFASNLRCAFCRSCG